MTISVASIGNTIANVYVSSGNTCVTWLSINNVNSATVTANVHVVPSGSSASATNQILTNLAITGNDTYQIYAGAEKLLLSNGDSIQAVANITSSLNAVVSHTTI